MVSGEKYYILAGNKVTMRTIKDDFNINRKVDAAIALTSGYSSKLYIFAVSTSFILALSGTDGPTPYMFRPPHFDNLDYRLLQNIFWGRGASL